MFSPSRYQSILYSHPKVPPRRLPRLSRHPEPSRSLAMFRDSRYGSALAWIGAFSVRGSRRVGKLLNHDSDPTPYSRGSVIAFRYQLLGTHEAIRLGVVSVAINHPHRDTPDLYFRYHAENDSRPCVSNSLTGDHGDGRKPRLFRMLSAGAYTPARDALNGS